MFYIKIPSGCQGLFKKNKQKNISSFNVGNSLHDIFVFHEGHVSD